VTPVKLYDRISRSGELGTSAITAPMLHTLMATAPLPQLARPESYGLMVLEASIRRRVEQGGMRVEQYVEQAGGDLGAVLAAVDNALAEVERTQHRWDSVTGRTHLISVLNPEPGRDGQPSGDSADAPGDAGPVLLEAPSAKHLKYAEEAVVAAVLSTPDVLAALHDRLVPEDFADAALANTYRSALELHARGEHIDMVTVAWEQQRHQHQHGPGIAPEQMIALHGMFGDPAYHADVVMRGSLTRLTRGAAEAVQRAAQHPGLHPSDVLHTTRMAYTAVRDTAARMSGRGSRTARLAGLSSPVPLGDALRDTSPAPPHRPTLASVPPPEPDRDR
jgi:replicative DNA helicase